jgi:ribosome-associated protein
MSPASESAASTADRVRGAVAAALDRKAQDLRVLNLGPVSDFTDYFLICTGTSERQVQAISEGIQESLAADGVRPLHVEGQRSGNWVLLDYGDLVAHVFQPEPRQFYGLERLWSDAADETREYAGQLEPPGS